MEAETSRQAQERERKRPQRQRNLERTHASPTLVLKGDLAPLNDFSAWVQDCDNGRVYFYGGVRCSIRDGECTSELFLLDLASMEWKNLTVCCRSIVLNVKGTNILLTLFFRIGCSLAMSTTHSLNYGKG